MESITTVEKGRDEPITIGSGYKPITISACGESAQTMRQTITLNLISRSNDQSKVNAMNVKKTLIKLPSLYKYIPMKTDSKNAKKNAVLYFKRCCAEDGVSCEAPTVAVFIKYMYVGRSMRDKNEKFFQQCLDMNNAMCGGKDGASIKERRQEKKRLQQENDRKHYVAPAVVDEEEEVVEEKISGDGIEELSTKFSNVDSWEDVADSWEDVDIT